MMTTSNEHNNAPAVPQGWKSALIPTEWTIGPSLFKDWCSQWFGPDADDDHLMRAAHALLGLAATPAPAPAQEGPSRNDETTAFERWLERTSPSGDVEQVHRQWLASSDYEDLFAQPAQEVGLTDDERQQVFRAAENRMVREINLSWRTAVVDEVIAAIRAKEQA